MKNEKESTIVSEVFSFILMILKALQLNINKDYIIVEDMFLKKPSTCNKKPILIDNGTAKSNISDYILVKLTDNHKSCSYLFFNKHINKILDLRIKFLFTKLLQFIANPDLLNKNNSDSLNQLLFNAYDTGTVDESLCKKWEQLTSILDIQNYSYSLIKLNINFGVVKTENQKEIKSCGIDDINKEIDYTYFTNYIVAIFPVYQLLLETNTTQLFGINFSKNEISILINIYKYIFAEFISQERYNFLDKPLYKELEEKKKKKCTISYPMLPTTLLLIKSFISLSKRIDTVIDELNFLGEMNDKKFNLSNVDIIAKLETNHHLYNSPIDSENNSDYQQESKKYPASDIKSLNERLNKNSLPDKQKKKLKKPLKRNYRGSIYREYSSVSHSEHPLSLEIKSVELDVSDECLDTLNPKDFKLSHRYILAGSGSGKSELLKVLALNDINGKDGNLILIDGGEKLATELAKLVDPKRLMLFDDSLDNKYTFSINPFDVQDKSIENISIQSKHIAKSFELLIESSWSDNMEAILVSVIYLLMRVGNGDIFVLKKLLNPDNQENLEALARTFLVEVDDKMHRDFILNDLNRIPSIKQTSDAIYMKLHSLLSDATLARCLTGKSSFDFEKAINTHGNIIIFKSKSNALGVFVMAMMQGIIEKRDSHNNINTSLYIDEFQNYVSPTTTKMLSELRKKGLHLTMAHQDIDDIKGIKRNVFANTNVKIIGQNGYEHLKTMSKELGIDVKKLENLGVGKFFYKADTNEAVKIQVTDKYIDTNGSITDKEWESVQKEQTEKYYKPKEDDIGFEYTVDPVYSISLEPAIDEF